MLEKRVCRVLVLFFSAVSWRETEGRLRKKNNDREREREREIFLKMGKKKERD
jgi:hypothetical protein